MNKNEYMLNGLQMLIDECRKTDSEILDVDIDNENWKITFKIKNSKWDLVFEDDTWGWV